MFGENASFIKTVEIDDSIFQCNPECAEKYLLQLEWSTDNEARQWRVVDSESVLTSNDESDHSAIWELESTIETQAQTIADMQQLIVDLTARVAALEA